VVVVPEASEYKPIKKVCLAVDEESASKNIDYGLLINNLNAYEAMLLAIHLHNNDEDMEGAHRSIFKRLEKNLGESVISKSLHTILSDDVEQEIDNFIHQHEVDLLVLVFREHGFIKRLFSPGVRTKMVYHSDTPILVLK
jgi:nucleotide-binding universal stress UspA family protein